MVDYSGTTLAGHNAVGKEVSYIIAKASNAFTKFTMSHQNSKQIRGLPSMPKINTAIWMWDWDNQPLTYPMSRAFLTAILVLN